MPDREDDSKGTWDRWIEEPGQFWSDASADYRETVDTVDAFNAGRIDDNELASVLRNRGLSQGHPLGCAYLETSSPLPPPGTGIKFDERIMPSDWRGTIGEVFMVRGLIGEDAFARVHRLLHPDESFCAPLETA